MFEPSVALTHPFTPPTAGLTYFAPNRPVKPLSEPGRIVAGSGRAFALFVHGESPFAQWIAMPTRSVWASVRAAEPAGASCESRASFQASEPSPKSDVTSPVGSVLNTRAPAACACVSGAVRVSPVPVAPAVPTVATTADSAAAPVSIVICWPAANGVTLATLTFVSPAATAAASVDWMTIAFAFSSSMLAAETPPTEQPAAVYVSHGAGVVAPPSVTMFGSGLLAAATVLFQYLNDDTNVGTPFDWK